MTKDEKWIFGGVGASMSEKLRVLGKNMRAELTIEDRHYHFKTYKNSFLGSDAIAWLIAHNHAHNPSEAIQIGNLMISEHIFHHVHDAHTLENDALFYRFYADEDKSLSKPLVTTASRHKQQVNIAQAQLKISGVELELAELKAAFAEMTSSAARLENDLARLSEDCTRLGLFAARITFGLIVHVVLSGVFNSLNWVAPIATTGAICYAVVYLKMDKLFTGYFFVLPKEVKQVNAGRKLTRTRRRSMSGSGNPEVDLAHIKRRESVSAPSGSSAHDIGNEGVRGILDEMKTTGVPYVCCDKITKLRLTPNDGINSLKINNDIFEGECIIALRGHEAITPSSYFYGKRRVSAAFVQGSFKVEVPFTDAFTGQAFSAPFKNVPSSILIQMLFSVLNVIAPNLEANVHADQPYLLTPLISACQALHIGSVDTKPELNKIFSKELSDADLEDTSVLGINEGVKMTMKERRSYFAKKQNLENFSLKPDGSVYTFSFWQDIFDPCFYKVNLPFGTYNVSKYMDGQPMSVLGKVGIDGADIWSVEMWHEELFESATHP